MNKANIDKLIEDVLVTCEKHYDYDDLMYKGAIFEKVFNKYNVIRIETSRGGPVIVQNAPLQKQVQR